MSNKQREPEVQEENQEGFNRRSVLFGVTSFVGLGIVANGCATGAEVLDEYRRLAAVQQKEITRQERLIAQLRNQLREQFNLQGVQVGMQPGYREDAIGEPEGETLQISGPRKDNGEEQGEGNNVIAGIARLKKHIKNEIDVLREYITKNAQNFDETANGIIDSILTSIETILNGPWTIGLGVKDTTCTLVSDLLRQLKGQLTTSKVKYDMLFISQIIDTIYSITEFERDICRQFSKNLQ